MRCDMWLLTRVTQSLIANLYTCSIRGFSLWSNAHLKTLAQTTPQLFVLHLLPLLSLQVWSYAMLLFSATTCAIPMDKQLSRNYCTVHLNSRNIVCLPRAKPKISVWSKIIATVVETIDMHLIHLIEMASGIWHPCSYWNSWWVEKAIW